MNLNRYYVLIKTDALTVNLCSHEMIGKEVFACKEGPSLEKLTSINV